jgi:hydrogenase maturation protease
MPNCRAPRIVILGLGNLLMRDDGVGVHAVRVLAEDPPPGAVVADVGTAVLDALPLLEEADFAIAIDAIDAGKPAGTLYRLSIDAVELPRRTGTLHELTLPAALRLLPEESRPPVTVLGVQPEVIEAGMVPSPVVEAAIPRLCEAVREAVRELQ